MSALESGTAPALSSEPSKTKAEARLKAKAIVDKWTVGLAATGWVPGAGIAAMATDQVMTRQIAECFGVPFDEEAKTHLVALLLSLLGAASEFAFLIVPLAGWVIKSVILTAKAKYFGEQVIKYFESKSKLPD